MPNTGARWPWLGTAAVTALVLAASSVTTRTADVKKLLDYGFAR